MSRTTSWPRHLAGLLLALELGLLAASCGNRSGNPPNRSPSNHPKLHEGPLSDFVAAAGLRWLVVGSPSRIARDPEWMRTLSAILPPERLHAFAEATGIELTKTNEALVAGYDYGTFYMVRVSGDSGDRAERRLVEWFMGRERRSSPHPAVIRYTGVVGGEPRTVLHVKDQFIGVALGDPSSARIAEAYARHQLEQSPMALEGSALSTLGTVDEPTVVRFFAAGPFPEAWAHGAHGLVGQALALGVFVSLRPNAGLELRVRASGDFGNGRSAIAQTYQDLAESSLGRLLSLDQPVSEPVVASTETGVELSVELNGPPIAAGLHTAALAEVWQILALPEPTAPN